MSNPTTNTPVVLDLQTGMPPIYPTRSKELLYDSLLDSLAFIFNPYGPQQLNLARSNHHW
jgi:hypothetical protein